jgi:hypothetical protein
MIKSTDLKIYIVDVCLFYVPHNTKYLNMFFFLHVCRRNSWLHANISIFLTNL